MSNLNSRFMSVDAYERMLHPLNISPFIIHFIENMIGKSIISVDPCSDADGYLFHFLGGETITFASAYLEHLKREEEGQGAMSRRKFEKMVGIVQSQKEEAFEKMMMNEVGEFSDDDFDHIGENKFYNSLRKVYWYRRLKNKSKKRS